MKVMKQKGKNKSMCSSACVGPIVFHIIVYLIAAGIYALIPNLLTADPLLAQAVVWLFIGIILLNSFWIIDAVKKRVYAKACMSAGCCK